MSISTKTAKRPPAPQELYRFEILVLLFGHCHRGFDIAVACILITWHCTHTHSTHSVWYSDDCGENCQSNGWRILSVCRFMCVCLFVIDVVILLLLLFVLWSLALRRFDHHRHLFPLIKRHQINYAHLFKQEPRLINHFIIIIYARATSYFSGKVVG